LNTIKATITDINSVDNLNIVSFISGALSLKMMSLDLNSSIKIGKDVILYAKPTAVAIGKNLSGMLSYSNKLNAVIETIDNGELLSSISLRVEDELLESIITVASSKIMDLKIADEVVVLIKASDLYIMKEKDA